MFNRLGVISNPQAADHKELVIQQPGSTPVTVTKQMVGGTLGGLLYQICGRVPVESSRMRLSATPGQVTHPGPTLGQHSDHVLRDLLGLHDDEIEQLVVAGAIE